MTLANLLGELFRRGVALEIRGDRVLYEAPPEAMTADILAALKAHKTELVGLPAEAGRVAREVWASTVEEVSIQWNEVAAAARVQGRGPPWLEEGTDLELQAAVRDAILAADLPAALEAIERWRAAWVATIQPRSAAEDAPASPIRP